MTNNNQDLQSAWEFLTRPDRKYSYFAYDGSYGDATEILVADVTDWTPEDWEKVEEAGDSHLMQTARDISAERGGIRPPIDDSTNHLSWDRNVLADNGYVLNDEEWSDLSEVLNRAAQYWFEDRDEANSTPDLTAGGEV